jgi:hypothetical protein
LALVTMMTMPRVASAQMTAEEELRRFMDSVYSPPNPVVVPDLTRAPEVEPEGQPTSLRPRSQAQTYRTRREDYATVPRGETVRSRERPDYAARGIRTGGLLFFPRLDLSEVYDDNIFRDPDGEEADLISVVSPNLRVRSDWNNHELAADIGADLGFYAFNPSEDFQDFHARFGGRLDVTSQSELRGIAAVERLHDDRDSPDDTAAIDPTVFYEYTVGADYVHRVGRIRYLVGGAVDRIDYLDNKQLDAGGNVVGLDNDDRDRTEAGGRARVGYQFRPLSEIFVETQVARLIYDKVPDDNGFDREAMLYRAEVGIETDFDGIIFGELRAGYLAKDFDDPAFGLIDGPSFGGALTWNVTQLTTVTAEAERTIRPTTLQNSSGALATSAGITVDHELMRNVILEFNAAWRQSDYEDIDRLDDTFRVGIGAEYLVNRNFAVSARYSYGERFSNDPGAEYSNNLLSLTLQAKF